MVQIKAMRPICCIVALYITLLFLYGCYSSNNLYGPGYSTYHGHYNYYGSGSGQAGGKKPSNTKVVQKVLWVSAVPRDVIHEVAPLETLWRISKMYGVSIESIIKANHLKDNKIFIGQKLLIPGARYLKNVIPLYPSKKWRYIVLHHTATEIGKARVINKCHIDRGFIFGLGYHFLIDNGTLGKGDGQIEVSPRWIKQLDGAHCKASGMNHRAIGIALVGNFNEEKPTEAQIRSLIALLKILTDYYDIPPDHVVGHRDVRGAKTDCPGRFFPWRPVKLALRQKN